MEGDGSGGEVGVGEFFYSGHPLYYYKDLGGIIQDAMLHGGNIKLTGTFLPPFRGQFLQINNNKRHTHRKDIVRVIRISKGY